MKVYQTNEINTHLSVLSLSVKIMYLFNMSCSWSIQSIRP